MEKEIQYETSKELLKELETYHQELAKTIEQIYFDIQARFQENSAGRYREKLISDADKATKQVLQATLSCYQALNQLEKEKEHLRTLFDKTVSNSLSETPGISTEVITTARELYLNQEQEINLIAQKIASMKTQLYQEISVDAAEIHALTEDKNKNDVFAFQGVKKLLEKIEQKACQLQVNLYQALSNHYETAGNKYLRISKSIYHLGKKIYQAHLNFKNAILKTKPSSKEVKYIPTGLIKTTMDHLYREYNTCVELEDTSKKELEELKNKYGLLPSWSFRDISDTQKAETSDALEFMYHYEALQQSTMTMDDVISQGERATKEHEQLLQYFSR